MPNRIIKESICSSDTVDQLNWFEEVFFYRLIVNCDDFGRFDARPSILKARMFPLKNVSEKQTIDALKKLEEVELLKLYEFENRQYLQLTTWGNHQTIRNKRSKYPSIEDALITNEYTCNQLNVNVPVIQSNPIQSNPNPIQSRNKAVPMDVQIKEFTGNDVFIEILSQFVEMRKKLRKPLTNYAFKLILNKLVELSKDEETQMNIVNQSIVNSWQTVYPLKQDYQKINFGNKKTATVPDWYDDYKKDLNNKPKKQDMSQEEIEKILAEAKEEL